MHQTHLKLLLLFKYRVLHLLLLCSFCISFCYEIYLQSISDLDRLKPCQIPTLTNHMSYHMWNWCFLKKVAFLGLPDYKVLDLELTSEVPAWDRLLLLRTEVPAGVCRRRVTGRMMVSLYERPASDRVSALQLSIINNHPHKWRQWWTLFWKDNDLNSNECLKRIS